MAAEMNRNELLEYQRMGDRLRQMRAEIEKFNIPNIDWKYEIVVKLDIMSKKLLGDAERGLRAL